MDSVRSFLGLWLGLTALVIAYAVLDLHLHPELATEQNFSMTPDITRIGQLWHWGGRLMKESAHSLLVCNAVVVGGVLALGLRYVAGRLRRPAPALAHDRVLIAAAVEEE